MGSSNKGCLLFIVVTAAALAFVWFKFGDQLFRTTRPGVEEGAAYGEGRSDRDCEQEATRGLLQCSDSDQSCSELGAGFLLGCLGAADVDSDYCSVPRGIDATDVSEEQLRRCRQSDAKERETCKELFKARVRYCDSIRN